MTLVEELKWRGLYNDSIPGTEEALEKESITAYIGYDPTAASLHIGNLATIMLLVHLQSRGGKPMILMGGATGRIGDPSGKKSERVLLSEEVIEGNLKAQKEQFGKFLDFSGEKGAEIVNNYDWYKEMNVLTFLRDVGKHLTVSYMMAKDSVKSRLESGISFTEFSYQLLQGYDFAWLYKNKGVKLQMGGSDQWGNITAGTELIRRMESGEAYALTCPLITKADGTKFGKSEGGNVWLDAELTSPYKFYQYFLNTSDEDATKFLKVFSLKSIKELTIIIEEHENAKGARIAQKALAEELTTRVHSSNDLEVALKASQLLFGKSGKSDLQALTSKQLLEVFDAVPQSTISKSELESGIPIFDFLTDKTGFYASKSEARRTMKEGGLRINKEQLKDEEYKVSTSDLLNDEFVLVQKGKKNYFLAKVN